MDEERWQTESPRSAALVLHWAREGDRYPLLVIFCLLRLLLSLQNPFDPNPNGAGNSF